MRRLLLAMTAVSALAVAAPAAAQYGRNVDRTDVEFNTWLDQRVDRLSARLEAGIDAGAISRSEARTIHAQMLTLVRLQRDYDRGGLTASERDQLQQRLRALREDMRLADGGRFDRDRRYGSADDWDYDDDDDLAGRGGPYDSDGDGWDDRDCDRDGDIDSGACNPARSGLGGFIDTILGQGGLRVGQRVTGELYAVPSEHRARFRDDSRFYYRSDGRRIYQIDARTDVVTRVYNMP
jgi:hypothetical protein